MATSVRTAEWQPGRREQMVSNGPKLDDLLWSLFACSAIAVAFISSSDQFQHWFIFPVTACGVAIGVDAVRWLRGRLDVFDPIGVVGILGVHFFFLAPLLHVYWDSWLLYVVPPDDWRPWLGRMACINFAGIVVYFIVRNLIQNRGSVPERASSWTLDLSRFRKLLVPALVATGALQVLVYAYSGGVMGYINSASADAAAFQGKGFLFMFSESFPIIAFLGFAIWAKDREKAKSWLMLFVVLLGYFVLKIFFGGLRGSRSNTIWGIIWAVGIIHFWIRAFPRKYILVGLIFIVSFMYVYGFYKAYGTDAVEIVQNPALRAQKSEQSGRTLEGTLLSDLGRADIQAYLLYRLWPAAGESDFRYAMGRTYVGAGTLLIPQSVWPGRPPTKVKEGTALLVGPGAYEQGVRASRVYGLAGEAMLNFGIVAVPLAFAALGLTVAVVHRWQFAWFPDDARILLVPFLVNLCFLVLTADSDGVVFFAVKNGTVPFLVVFFSVTRKAGRPAMLLTRGATDETLRHIRVPV